MDPFEMYRFLGLMDTAEDGGGSGGGGGGPRVRIGLPGRQPQARVQPEPEPETQGFNDQGFEDEPFEAQPEPREPQYEEPEPQEDWRQQALKDPRVQARFDEAIFGKQEQQPPPQIQEDPLDVARRELDEIEAEFEQFGALKQEQLKDPAAVQRYFELSDKRGRAASKVSRLAAERSQQLQRQQYVSQAEQQNYQRFAQQDPNFTEDVQGEFRQYLTDRGISQELMADPDVFQTVAKSFLYEKGQQGGVKRKLPPPPNGQGHTRQPVQQPQEPVDPDAEIKAQFWGTSAESVQRRNSTEDGRPLQYEKGGHDVPYLRYSDTSRRRRRSA